MKTKFIQVAKSKFANESEALDYVLTQNKLASDTPAKHSHTAKLWRWEIEGTESAQSTESSEEYPFGLFSVEKSGEEEELRDALHLASAHFETFDGNIKRVTEKEDEQFFVFTKIR